MLGHTQRAPPAYSRKPSRLILTPHSYPLGGAAPSGPSMWPSPTADHAGVSRNVVIVNAGTTRISADVDRRHMGADSARAVQAFQPGLEEGWLAPDGFRHMAPERAGDVHPVGRFQEDHFDSQCVIV